MQFNTAQIIMVVKQPQYFGEFSTFRDVVNCYMSHKTKTDISFYNTKSGKEIIDKIVFEALCDYIDTCDKPSVILNEIKRCKAEYGEIDNNDDTETILRALSVVYVFRPQEYGEDYRFVYVNGFTDENSQIPSPDDFID